LYRKPANIPPAVREAPAFTPGRMSLGRVLVSVKSLQAVISVISTDGLITVIDTVNV